MVITHTLSDILIRCLGPEAAADLLDGVEVAEDIRAEASAEASRAVIAQALGLILFRDLLERVPDGRRYVADQRQAGRRILFDHGAVRTVAAPCGALPPGKAAFARFLEPLGYRCAAVYPLDRIGMTGHAYRHLDFPEALPQYFVSELHPERFSPAFQASAARLLGTTRDPLDETARQRLGQLARQGGLDRAEAAALVQGLFRCFGCLHDMPAEADYDALLAESAEMAWIATEGNSFNHVTDRVADIERTAEELKRQGFPLKERIEISASGRVRQTALRAASVERRFRRDGGGVMVRRVPGSFFEFISRASQDGQLDLGFDSGNAQGIFKMTTAGQG